MRIDSVHYCRREAVLSDRRKISRFNVNGIPEDPAVARLKLFCRTVRDDATRRGHVVQYLKTPYMLRESCFVELAQTIAVLPNLMYVDLPEGMFSDEQAYATLRLGVERRCPNLRKATYAAGSERSFANLMTGQIWPFLEVLELKRLGVDPAILRGVLVSLPRLRALKVAGSFGLSDEALSTDPNLYPLPALKELVLKDTPGLTCAGLAEYLSFHETQQALTVLTLKDTGIQASELQEVLALAPSMETLVIQSKISRAFPLEKQFKLLVHDKLRTLRYEISASAAASPYDTKGYYTYLASSIMSGGLPKLQRLYVLNEEFPDQLQGIPPVTPGLAPPLTPGLARPQTPVRTRAGSISSSVHSRGPSLCVSPPDQGLLSPTSPGRQRIPRSMEPNRFSSNNPYGQAAGGVRRSTASAHSTQTLEVYTKSDELGKWNFARVDSLTKSAARAARRPSSSYGLEADVTGHGWNRGDARRSIMVNDGAGLFLPVQAVADEKSPGGFSLGPVPLRKRAEQSQADEDGRRSWSRA